MTHKSPLLHSLLCITLSISLLLPSGTPSCVFDSVKPNITSIPHKYVTYNGPVRNIVDMDIVKRSVPVGFQPIRFHVHYYNIKEELSDVEQSRLREVVSEMVTEVPQILSGKFLCHACLRLLSLVLVFQRNAPQYLCLKVSKSS